MSHQIWHAFYYDRTAESAPPCRSEVIEADNEEAAVRVAREHLHGCKRVSLESPRWMQGTSLIIVADEKDHRPSTLH
jgi:hypothetical protein